MKAFLSDGKGLGSEHQDVTRDYKSRNHLFKYAIVPFQKSHGYCKAEIFMNWDNRYGKPDLIMTFDGKIVNVS